MMNVNINNADLQMEVDTGTTLSIISKKNIREALSHKKAGSNVEVLQCNVKDVCRWAN